MRNTLFLVLIISTSISGCNSEAKKGVKVSGKVENPISGELALLNQFEFDGIKTLDTIEVEASGAFEFYIAPDTPSFYRLNFYNRQQMNLILDGTERDVVIMLEGNNPSGEVSVTGSKHTTYLQQIEGMMRDQQSDVQDLNKQALEARNSQDDQTMNRLRAEYFSLMVSSQNDIKDFIWTVTPSLAAFYGLESLPIEEHFSFHDSVAQRFIQELPGHPFTEELNKRVSTLKKLAIGSMAPEITLPTPDGEMISLSSLRGKYVMIDFWAAWCKPCRAENPNVVRLYEKYGGDQFEILGVSLDRTKEAWVGAIEKDGLKWLHVSDLQYFNSKVAADYQITAIPATYLIAPDGTIAEKGLRGQSLAAKLSELFD
ncbi:MAG: peroxiredoxin [Marinoscillum sp.]|jgi:peroxiredoxin